MTEVVRRTVGRTGQSVALLLADAERVLAAAGVAAGARTGAVMMCTLLGMALGGWMSGKVFDLTGSYQAAFVNGLAWNAVNLAIAWMLLRQGTGRSLSLGRGLR